MARRNRIDPSKLSFYEPPPPKRDLCVISGKQIFVNELEAQTEAKRAKQERGLSLNVYYCFDCSGWHFTRAK